MSSERGEKLAGLESLRQQVHMLDYYDDDDYHDDDDDGEDDGGHVDDHDSYHDDDDEALIPRLPW